MLGAPDSAVRVSLFPLYALIPYETEGRKRYIHHALAHTQDQLLYVLQGAVCPLTEEIDFPCLRIKPPPSGGQISSLLFPVHCRVVADNLGGRLSTKT